MTVDLHLTSGPGAAPGPDGPRVMVSACLAGVPCRYDGNARPDPAVVAQVERGDAVALCAEVLGGLSTPRRPAEIQGGDGADVLDGRARVVADDGEDLTDEFVRGARVVADYVAAHGIDEAVLQSRSPSCGCGQIYDGAFGGGLVDGDGVVAALLAREGVTVSAVRGSAPGASASELGMTPPSRK